MQSRGSETSPSVGDAVRGSGLRGSGPWAEDLRLRGFHWAKLMAVTLILYGQDMSMELQGMGLLLPLRLGHHRCDDSTGSRLHDL